MDGILHKMAGTDPSPQPRQEATPNVVPPAQPEPPSGTFSPVPGTAVSSSDVSQKMGGGMNAGGGGAPATNKRSVRPADLSVLRRKAPLTPDQLRLVDIVRRGF